MPNITRTERALGWALFILWVAVSLLIVVLALWPEGLDIGPYGDELIHLASGAWLIAGPVLFVPQKKYVWAGAVLILILGAALEWIQSFMPGRQSSLSDFVFDSGGVAVGLVIGLLLYSGYKADARITPSAAS